jgi:hypothetical protein
MDSFLKVVVLCFGICLSEGGRWKWDVISQHE